MEHHAAHGESRCAGHRLDADAGAAMTRAPGFRGPGLAALPPAQRRAGGRRVLSRVLSALLAPWIAPYDPNHGDFAAFNAPPSADASLGTDFGGRDVLSRVLYGGRISLLIGFSSMSQRSSSARCSARSPGTSAAGSITSSCA